MKGQGRHIYFTEPTLTRLESYLQRNFGTHRALSMIVQKAVDEYLEKNDNKDKKENAD